MPDHLPREPRADDRATPDRHRLATCVRVLADVHRADGYPMAWPADPSSWLSPDGVQGAWVAESGGTPVGHAVVTGPGDDARRRSTDWWRCRGCSWRRTVAGTASRGRRRDGTGPHRRLGRAGGARVVADVVEGSPAVGFHERMGWRLVDRRPAGWAPPDGREPTSRVYLSPGP